MRSQVQQHRIAFIGFGEAARAFARAWAGAASAGTDTRAAFDIAADAAPERFAPAARSLGVALSPDRAAALSGAGHVFCLVTADQALAAARECAPHLGPGTVWLDGNSCAPQTKRAAASVIEASGAQYLDMAIMAPVYPRGHRTPLLLAGSQAAPVAGVLAGWDMQARAVGGTVGDASGIKMLRSVIVKGIEALCAESFLAARRAGVEAEVIASLDASHPEWDWPRLAAYNLERMLRHGTRRSAEMHEVAATLRALGFEARLTEAVADWQARIGGGTVPDPLPDDLSALSDLTLARL
ncbi:MAG: NAD(P)-dependent oxidoreductase [Rhodobacteraceae bacterium]|nr:NAD(P)-dependent oxidoreductase [Paracoccaceae bacterium]